MNTKTLKWLFGGIYVICMVAYGYIYYRYYVANVFSSLLFYISLFLLGYGILHILKKKLISKNTFTNLVLSMSVGLSFLFLSELTLRYVFRIGLSHSERTGGHYRSYYKNTEKRRLKLKKKNLILRRKNMSQFISSKGEFNYEHNFNELGLRDQPLAPLLNDTTSFRIFALGDSFTEGVGTAQDSTWLKTMERILNDNSTSKVSTFNLGVGGSEPKTNLKNLEPILAEVHPNLLIQAINQSDINDLSIRYISNFKGPWWEVFYANSIILRGILHSFFGYTGPLLSPSNHKKAKKYATEQLLLVVDQLTSLQQQHQFQLILIFHPFLPEYMSTNQMMLHDLAKQLSSRPNMKVINMMDVLKEKKGITPKNASDYYWPNDGHHNPLGYKVWGEALADWLLEHNMIPAQ